MPANKNQLLSVALFVGEQWRVIRAAAGTV